MLNFVYAYSITYYIHLCTLVMRDFEMLKVEMISSCLCTECQGESVEAGTTSY